MGKGDKKTKRGKIVNGSYGRSRRRSKVKNKYVKPIVAEAPKEAKAEIAEEKPEVKKPAAKKATPKKTTAKKPSAPVKSEEKETKKAVAKKTPAKKTPAKKTVAKAKTETVKKKPKEETKA